MDEICRLCMSNIQCDKVKIPLFQEQSPEFVHILVTLLGFPINIGDGLPSHICVACSEAAMEAHKFKTKCIESNGLLCERLQTENESLFLPNEQNHHSSYEDDPDDFEVQEAEDIETIVKKECETEADIEMTEMANMLFSCDMCYYKTDSKRDFDGHNRKNHANSWQCIICDYRTSVKSEQKKHWETHSGEDPFQCKVCPSTFKKLVVLKKHMTTHSQEKPFQCKVCHRTFRVSGNLAQHMAMHSQERPFQCNKCHSKFKMPGGLQRHMRTHSQERPFQCKVCHSKFKEPGVLKKHIMTHSQERPFQCKKCHSKFKMMDNLKRHMVMHSQERPFQCKVCHSKFKVSRNLKRHMLIHPEEKTFETKSKRT